MFFFFFFSSSHPVTFFCPKISFLLHTIPFLESWSHMFAFWQVEVLLPTEWEQGTLGVFVVNARARLHTSIRGLPTCVFVYSSADSQWKRGPSHGLSCRCTPFMTVFDPQSPILKDLHSCSKPLPRLQSYCPVLFCVKQRRVIYGRTAFDDGVGWGGEGSFCFAKRKGQCIRCFWSVVDLWNHTE